MHYKSSFLRLLAGLTLLMSLAACTSHQGEKDENYNKEVVINEVMATNYTGILNSEGELHDWIEIKNVSSKEVDLSKFSLEITKKAKKDKAEKNTEAKDKEKKAKDKEKKAEEVSSSILPKLTLKPGECILLFDYKFPAKKATLRLLRKNGSIMSEVKYKKLRPDECYRRLPDGSYEKSYLATPGFDNTEEGYEAAVDAIHAQRKSPLLIWQIYTKESKHRTAWVQLRNVSDKTLQLHDYSLAQKADGTGLYQLPEDTLAPGQTYMVQCSEETFRFDGGDETVVLLRGKKFQDGACGAPTPYDVVMGRQEGHKGFYYGKSSAGTLLPETARRFIAPLPTFSQKPGIYNKTQQLPLALSAGGRTIHYTTDGSWPTAASPVWKDTLRITKTTVLRAYCEGDSLHMASPVATATYLLNEGHKLPVMCISVNNDDLYDFHHGIYAAGPDASTEYPHKGANYWKKGWNKHAHVEFYDGKDGFEADCGLAIFGGFSRTMAKKSFKLKFNNEFGPSHLTYDIYNEGEPMKMKNFVLRSGSQDGHGTMVRDEFFTSLMAAESPHLLVQRYRPVVLYINGGYFGVYYVREKIDRHFVANHLGVSNDSITILMSKAYNEEGSKTEYLSLLNYIRTHDLTQAEHYKYVSDRVDLEGLIDFKLGEIYAANFDVGNVRYVHSADPKGDRKWHFVYYDLDLTWAGHRPAAYYLRESGRGCDPALAMHNVMISRLLANPDFRKLFLQRLSHHLHTTWQTKHATRVFDNLISTIRPEMQRNCQRWASEMSYASWEKYVSSFREKFPTRSKLILDDIRQELSITPEEEKQYFSDLKL